MLALNIRNRPFAVEPVTGLMLPDGIFDCSIRNLQITCYVTNISDRAIAHGFIALPAQLANGIQTKGSGYGHFGRIMPGGSARVAWLCDFAGATPGKVPIRFEVSAQFADTPPGQSTGFDGFITKNIFVSRTRFDSSTGFYECEVPEGRLSLKFTESQWTKPFRLRGVEGQAVDFPGLPIPKVFKTNLRTPAGQELRIPFGDPWWKVVAWIIAAVATIGALVEASQGQGNAWIGIGGHGHDNPEDYNWCFPDPTAGPVDSPAAILSAIANGAIAVGLADDADPWSRGRAKLGSEGSPISESVTVSLKLPPSLPATQPYAVNATWAYRAETATGLRVDLDVGEERPNIHSPERWDIRAPAKVKMNEPLVVEAMPVFTGRVLAPDSVYGFATFTSPGPRVRSFRIPLEDNGRDFDRAANDGWFTAGLLIPELNDRFPGPPFDAIGIWAVELIAQDINDADDKMPPEEAATHIGGMPILSPYALERSNSLKGDCPVDKGLVKIEVVA